MDVQEVLFLEFHIPNFRKVLWQTCLCYCFGKGFSPPRCQIFLFHQLTLLLLCFSTVKLWHQKKWMQLKISAYQTINNHVLKWKIHAYFLFHFSFWRSYFNFVKNYKLGITNSVISCFTLSSAFIILADIIFYNFFRIHSFNLIWENIFVINFSMLAYSPKNCQNPPRVIKHFLLMLPYWTKSGIGYLQVLLDNT